MKIVALYFAIGLFTGLYVSACCWKKKVDTAKCLAVFFATCLTWTLWGLIFLCDRFVLLCDWIDKKRRITP